MANSTRSFTAWLEGKRGGQGAAALMAQVAFEELGWPANARSLDRFLFLLVRRGYPGTMIDACRQAWHEYMAAKNLPPDAADEDLLGDPPIIARYFMGKNLYINELNRGDGQREGGKIKAIRLEDGLLVLTVNRLGRVGSPSRQLNIVIGERYPTETGGK